MSGKKVSESNLKAVCSVSSLCKDLGISRAQFYNLQKMGVFPKGLKDKRTGRPYFDVNLQNICHDIRRTGIGNNGEPYLFYNPRWSNPNQNCITMVKNKSQADARYSELIDTLRQMGLTVSSSQVADAVKELYPDGFDEQDQGLVIRNLYRFLRERL